MKMGKYQSRKESKKKTFKEIWKFKNKIEEGGATRQNIQKQVVKVQKLHHKLDNVRFDYINKTVSQAIEQKPSHITVKDSNVSVMMKKDFSQY
ncbi:TPA: transposase [Clostridioides difficile]|nr:transposase [Clostridioides difficile]MBH7165999.1 transposase [Clostridioides difficile]MBH7847496.1 transposase [Clostridioides difficile]MBY1348223.1 transposase [Clostridioides difficile]MBY1661973.1 transposase [Clostridioides difficile]